ncbi:putative reverse transcriptase domain-containing protein [Tanacetum coccineum]
MNPRYVGPFKVLEKVRSVAYKLELPEELSRVHNTFHVTNLKKCYIDEPLTVLLDGLHFDDKLQFVEEPVEIMDHEVKRLKRSRILIIKTHIPLRSILGVLQYDSDCDDEATANAIFMANLSPVGSTNDDKLEYIENIVSNNESYDELTSNNNVIFYTDYMLTIGNDDDNYVPLPVQKNDKMLSVIEQMKSQVEKCNMVNQESQSVNESLTSELERYKDIVRLLEYVGKDGCSEKEAYLARELNIVVCDRNRKFDTYKQESSEKYEKNISEIVDLEKAKKELENIVFKVGQSAQTKHMLTKPQNFYDETHKTALGYQNPLYISQARRKQPALYNGHVLIDKNPSVCDSEETLILAKESRLKMLEKQTVIVEIVLCVVERRNRSLVEAARTMLIFSKSQIFLWAEAIATPCYTQTRSLIHTRYNKTPYELLRDHKPELRYLYVFGALCYPTNDFKDLEKLQPKVDIGILIGFSPSKKASGIMLNEVASTSTKPPTKNDLDLMFQPMFDEYFKPPSVVSTPIFAATLLPPDTAGVSSIFFFFFY